MLAEGVTDTVEAQLADIRPAGKQERQAGRAKIPDQIVGLRDTHFQHQAGSHGAGKIAVPGVDDHGVGIERLDRDAGAGKSQGDTGAGIVQGLEHAVEGDGQILVGVGGFDFGNSGDESVVPGGGVAGDPRVQVTDHVPQFRGGNQGRELITVGLGGLGEERRRQEEETQECQTHARPLYRGSSVRKVGNGSVRGCTRSRCSLRRTSYGITNLTCRKPWEPPGPLSTPFRKFANVFCRPNSLTVAAQEVFGYRAATVMESVRFHCENTKPTGSGRCSRVRCRGWSR